MIYNASILSKIQGTLKCMPAWYRYFFKLSTFLTFPFLMFPKCFSYKYNRQRMESEISLEPDWTQLRHWPICNRLSIRNISLHVCTLYKHFYLWSIFMAVCTVKYSQIVFSHAERWRKKKPEPMQLKFCNKKYREFNLNLKLSF